MRTFMAATAAALTLALAPLSAHAHDYKVGALEIEHPWTRATPPGAAAGGAFLIIVNEGTEADTLIGAASPVAGRVELHTMTMDDGVMKMRQIKGGIEISPGDTATLAPGGNHVMLMDLKEQIVTGKTVPLTLTFEKAGSVDIDLAVSPPGAPGPKMNGHGNGSHGHETHDHN
ncbi:copper chaperone PCu(A)C [Amorphus coralli]|uniref:copper chaperone PCu(A)C n=1 Tax=Amorphus coralli TaxID=340680 RepID=UPI00036399B8|nr:copper chaperone PCu(A)C [Amorphus coralli]